MTKFEWNYNSSEDECSKKCKRGKRGYPGFQGPPGPQGPQGPQGPTGNIPECHTSIFNFNNSQPGTGDFEGKPVILPGGYGNNCFTGRGETLTATKDGSFLISINLQFQNRSALPATVNLWLNFYNQNSDRNRAFTFTVPGASDTNEQGAGYRSITPAFVSNFNIGDVFGLRWSVVSGDPDSVFILFTESDINPGYNYALFIILEFFSLPVSFFKKLNRLN